MIDIMGYGRRIIEDRGRFVEQTLSAVDERLDPSLRSSSAYALSTGGKRLRPIICILACELVGGTYHDTVAAFTALELIHNATLIHDDIIDEDQFRRGMPSTPNKYGVKKAVLTGDALLSLGLTYAASTGNTEVVNWLSETSLRMVSGIQRQMDINGRQSTEEEFLEVNYLKSGSLFEAAGALGALCSGADDETVMRLARFGRLFGDAYQINDDILDTDMGNDARSDLQNGDITLPIIYALESGELSDDEKETLLSIKKGGNPSPDEVRRLLVESSAIKKCSEKMNAFIDDADAILNSFDQSQARDGLMYLLDELRG